MNELLSLAKELVEQKGIQILTGQASTREIVQKLAELLEKHDCNIKLLEDLANALFNRELSLGMRVTVREGFELTEVFIPRYYKPEVTLFGYAVIDGARPIADLVKKLFLNYTYNVRVEVAKSYRTDSLTSEYKKVTIEKYFHVLDSEYVLTIVSSHMYGTELAVTVLYEHSSKTPQQIKDTLVHDKKELAQELSTKDVTPLETVLRLAMLASMSPGTSKVRLVVYELNKCKIVELWKKTDNWIEGIAFKTWFDTLFDVEKTVEELAKTHGIRVEKEHVANASPPVDIYEIRKI